MKKIFFFSSAQNKIEARRSPLLMFLLRVDKLVFKLPSVGDSTKGGGRTPRRGRGGTPNQLVISAQS